MTAGERYLAEQREKEDARIAERIAQREKKRQSAYENIARIEQMRKSLVELAAKRQRELADAQAIIRDVTPETDPVRLAQALLHQAALEKILAVINDQLRPLDRQIEDAKRNFPRSV